jgi:hypothetical protein
MTNATEIPARIVVTVHAKAVIADIVDFVAIRIGQ